MDRGESTTYNMAACPVFASLNAEHQSFAVLALLLEDTRVFEPYPNLVIKIEGSISYTSIGEACHLFSGNFIPLRIRVLGYSFFFGFFISLTTPIFAPHFLP